MNTATLNATMKGQNTTITLAGDLATEGAALVEAMSAVVEAAEGSLLVDLTAITSLGTVGAGLLFGAYRGAPWGCRVAFRSGPWARTVALITRGVAQEA